MKVGGLDLSLTGTGLKAPGEQAVTLAFAGTRGVHRLDVLCDAIAERAKGWDVAVIEDYAYSRADAHAHEIGELGGCVRLDLYRLGVPFAIVNPATLKKFATNKGNASKQEVLIAARERFGYKGTSFDEADATVLAAMGELQYDFDARAPVAWMREALHKIAWPVLPAKVMRA